MLVSLVERNLVLWIIHWTLWHQKSAGRMKMRVNVPAPFDSPLPTRAPAWWSSFPNSNSPVECLQYVYCMKIPHAGAILRRSPFQAADNPCMSRWAIWWMVNADGCASFAISSSTSESAGTPSILGHLPGSMSGLCFLRLPSRPNTYKLRQHQSLLSDTHARPVTVGQSVWELGRLSRSSENHQLLLCSEKGWYHQV